MITVLYDTNTGQLLTPNRFHNGYWVDGVKPELPEGIVELEEIVQPIPQVDATQKATPQITVTAEQYIHGYLIEEKTPQEQLQDVEAWRQSLIATRKQFNLALAFYPYGEGVLKDAIDALVASLSEPMKTVIEITLDGSTIFRRVDENLIQLSAALQMSPEEVDDFFMYAIEEGWNE